MNFSHVKQLFLVGFLGLTLVGCSSTPNKTDDSAANKTPAVTPASQSNAQADAKAQAAAAEAARKAKADDLFAQLQGRVVNFDFDRSEVKSNFYAIIKLNADYLAANADANVTLKGYCDERGTREYNLALGERRANAVKNALIAEGVSPSRIRTISFGEEDPVNPAHNEAAWAENRRVEFAY